MNEYDSIPQDREDYSDVLAVDAEALGAIEKGYERDAREKRTLEALFVADVAALCLALAPVMALIVLIASGGLRSVADEFGDLVEIGAYVNRGALVLAFVLGVLWLAAFYRAIPREFARSAPWFAALGMLVPVFNLFHYFRAHLGGDEDARRALVALEGNRLNLPSAKATAIAAFIAAGVSFLALVALLLVPDVRGEYEPFDAVRFLLGSRPVIVADDLSLLLNLVAFGAIVVAGAFYATTCRRMTKLATRLLELKTSRDPLADDREIAEARENLQRILDAPTSR